MTSNGHSEHSYPPATRLNGDSKRGRACATSYTVDPDAGRAMAMLPSPDAFMGCTMGRLSFLRSFVCRLTSSKCGIIWHSGPLCNSCTADAPIPNYSYVFNHIMSIGLLSR